MAVDVDVCKPTAPALKGVKLGVKNGVATGAGRGRVLGADRGGVLVVDPVATPGMVARPGIVATPGIVAMPGIVAVRARVPPLVRTRDEKRCSAPSARSYAEGNAGPTVVRPRVIVLVLVPVVVLVDVGVVVLVVVGDATVPGTAGADVVGFGDEPVVGVFVGTLGDGGKVLVEVAPRRFVAAGMGV